MEQQPRIIATVINDVVYDQRMIRICSSLSSNYNVLLLGREKSEALTKQQVFKQKRLKFLLKKGPLFYLVYNIRVFFYLIFARYDIVHAVDLDTLPAGFFATKLRGKKLVYDAHEYFTEVPELINRPKVQNVWLTIEKFIIPKIKYAITVGGEIAKEYEKKYNVPFVVVRNCPVLIEQEMSTKSGAYLLYQGALNKGRGLEALIEAMQEIDIPLKIAGSGDLDEELKRLVDNFNIAEKVEFLGLLEPSQLPELTQNAFAGINVSENLGLSYYYSLNNKYFDYIQAGLPSITNPFPEYVALNNEFECCVFANANATEIAASVKLLLNDASLYTSLKKNCLLARQHLTWQLEEKKLITLYEAVTK